MDLNGVIGGCPCDARAEELGFVRCATVESPPLERELEAPKGEAPEDRVTYIYERSV